MALETATYISDLVSTNPTASDAVSAGDDHIRLLKSTIKTTFPNVSGAVTPTHTELNYVDGVTSAIQTQLDAKAPLASPTFTGTPTLPTGTIATTQSPGDNTTKVATTAFVTAAITAAPRAVGEWVLLREVSTSAVAAIDFVNGTSGVVMDTTYDLYEFEFNRINPASGTPVLWVRTSTDAGSTFTATANYGGAYETFVAASGVTVTNGAGQTAIPITQVTTGGFGACGSLLMHVPGVAGQTRFTFMATSLAAAPTMVVGYGYMDTSRDTDGVRFLWSGGQNFATGGVIRLYGRKKS